MLKTEIRSLLLPIPKCRQIIVVLRPSTKRWKLYLLYLYISNRCKVLVFCCFYKNTYETCNVSSQNVSDQKTAAVPILSEKQESGDFSGSEDTKKLWLSHTTFLHPKLENFRTWDNILQKEIMVETIRVSCIFLCSHFFAQFHQLTFKYSTGGLGK